MFKVEPIGYSAIDRKITYGTYYTPNTLKSNVGYYSAGSNYRIPVDNPMPNWKEYFSDYYKKPDYNPKHIPLKINVEIIE